MLACTIVFVAAFFHAVVVHLASTIVGFPEGSDSTGTIAGFWQMRHEGGYDIVGTLHHTYTGAPFGWTQPAAINAQVLLVNLPAYLLARVVDPVAAYNLVTLAGYVLSGAAMYALVRYLGCNIAVAAWAALVFIIFPFHLVHQEHASLIHLEALTLLLGALVAVVRRPSWPRFALLAAANLACWLTSGYFGPMAAITTLAFALGAAFTMDRKRAATFVGGAALATLAAGLVIGLDAVASGTDTGAGLDRGSGNLSIYGVRPVQLVLPPPQSIVFGKHLASFWATRFHGSDATEIVSYLGLVTIALAALWVVVAWRSRKRLAGDVQAVTAGLAASFVVGLAFAAPSPLILFGHKTTWTPARALWTITSAFRIQARWDFLLMATLVPLAALGLQRVWQRLSRRHVAVATGTTACVAALSVCELLVHPAVPRFRTAPAPPEYAALRSAPPGIVANYPLGYSNNYFVWQHIHGRRVLNGAPQGSFADRVRLMLLDPTEPATAPALALLGVTAIGIHPQALVGAEVEPRDPHGAPGYELVGRFADAASVWRVTAQPAPALLTLSDGFDVPRRATGGTVEYPLANRVAALDLTARGPRTVRVAFVATPGATDGGVLRIGDRVHALSLALHGPTNAAFVVAIPRGRSRLVVRAAGRPVSISALRVLPASAAPELHATLVTHDVGF